MTTEQLTQAVKDAGFAFTTETPFLRLYGERVYVHVSAPKGRATLYVNDNALDIYLNNAVGAQMAQATLTGALLDPNTLPNTLRAILAGC